MRPTRMRVIKETPEYRILKSNFDIHTIYFRAWQNGMLQVKLDDGFAQSQGYNNLPDMLKKNPEMRQYIMQFFGKVPEWVVVPESLPMARNINPLSLN